MLALINSCGLQGIDGYIIKVESSISVGLPSFDIVGLPDAAVKESKERVRAAVGSIGFNFPISKVTINLAPGNIKKEGPGFDLPIAIAILLSSGQITCENVKDYLFLGELALGGDLRPVNGVLPMIMEAKGRGMKKAILPMQNAKEAAVVQGIAIYGARNLHEVIAHIGNKSFIHREEIDIDALFANNTKYEMDFADVKGQANVKRGLEIAAAGGHNCLMIGSPGSGKTMLAARLPSILPDLSFEEALQITKIHSTAGTLPSGIPIITTRPFRSPHHTVSTISLSGGGRIPRPGEVSLSHGGVLFLDELPEFRADALEILRQPLEDGNITISRVNSSITYPCNFMMVAAMNPCKCGYFGDDKKVCTCSPSQIQKYLHKLSGPLLDRIDIHIDVAAVEYVDLTKDEKEECSASIKERVNKARKIQIERYTGLGFYCNADMTTTAMERFCKLGEQQSNLLKVVFEKLGLTARAYSRIIKMSRTIADLEGCENIGIKHISEAIQYRTLDRKFFG